MGEIFVRSFERDNAVFLSRGRGEVGGFQSQRASFDSQTLSAANDASSGNGEGSSWPEVRHIRTTPLAARTCTCTPLPAHKYVATSTSFLPIYFVPRISSGFSRFLKREREGERDSEIEATRVALNEEILLRRKVIKIILIFVERKLRKIRNRSFF